MLTGLMAQGKLSTAIDSTYSVKDIKKAVEVAAGGQRKGKVIVVGDGS
jgi:trans-2-enoyl-CoA reductase